LYVIKEQLLTYEINYLQSDRQPTKTLLTRPHSPTLGSKTANINVNNRAVLPQRMMTARYITGCNEPLRRYGNSKLSKMAACRQLGFDVTGNSAIRSADPENPTLESNMKCIGLSFAEIWPFAYLWAYWTPV